MSKLIEVNLKDLKESPSNPRKAFDDVELQELADSIKEVGILQPLVVMPKGKDYEIVCGHRRFRAAKLAGIEIVPAMLREDLTHEQALELQITENLQRKDVHPLDEAIAFKRLQEERKFSIEEVANRVGKSERFVTQRMKLNDLIDEIQKPFYVNKLTLTDAFKLARLTERDQKEFFKEDLQGWEKENFYINDVDWAIRHTMLKLDSATFNILDAELVKNAGSCAGCLKNTSTNASLFPDQQEDAKCTDKQCFFLKTKRHIDVEIKKLEDSGEEFFLLYSEYDADVDVKKLTEEGYSVLKKYNDFDSYSGERGRTVTGIWINSSQSGKVEKVRLSVKGDKKAQDPDDPETQIQKIYTRETRAKELDSEKVYEAVYAEFKKDEPSSFRNSEKDLDKYECVALACAVLKGMSWSVRDSIIKELNGGKDWEYNHSTGDYDRLFQNLTQGKLNKLLRIFTLTTINHYKGANHERTKESKAIYEIAKDQIPKKVTEIETSQAEIRAKRQERINKRVAKLEAEKSAKKESSKPASKKTTKKKSATKKKATASA